MPIETKDLVLYESERLTDNDDGGGKYNGQIEATGSRMYMDADND